MKKFPVVALLGARQVGKSTILQKICPQGHFFDLENSKDFARIQSDPALLFKEVPPPYVFDEAQLCPKLFNAIRVEVDKKREVNGRFLLSGPSSPELLGNLSESLAGRMAMLEISTFNWSERGDIEASSFYTSLNSMDDLLKLKPLHTHSQILSYCLHGGYPEPYLKRSDIKYYDLWFENYFKSYIERDVRKLFPAMNIQAYNRFVQMLSHSTGEIVNASNFARSLDVSQPTVKKYMGIIEGTFLWRKIPPYEKSGFKRIVKMPKGYIKDTGLINYLLNIHSEKDLKGHQLYGRIWESFVTEQILKGLKSNLIKHSYYFYRTNNQTEIDLIIEGRGGPVPIEIKAGSVTTPKQIKPLINFVKNEKIPFGIVVNNGDEIFKITENIIQIPCIYL
ncbi:MAG: ATP-binding protein [Halobacteriovoraceae bacterium]|nr:ATP-binding protein [Halobacteriovoraceae bacterium]